MHEEDQTRHDVGHPDGTLPATTLRTEMRSIVVNGRIHAHAGETIDRGELARLAFPGIAPTASQALTVAYDGGPSGFASGILPAGASTAIENGQTFSVSLTDKS